MTPLARDGWQVFPAEPAVANWVARAAPAARRAVADPANAGWLRCGGTWFVGVDVLPNDAAGAVDGSGPLAGGAVAAALAATGLRRMLKEPHAFILGLPLTQADPGAAPLAVYEGSHHLVRAALGAVLDGLAPGDWADTDLTEAYHAVRKKVFATCRRVTLQPAPGQALLIHRLALHGIAPWEEGARADAGGRMIAYFRPVFPPERTADWLWRD